MRPSISLVLVTAVLWAAGCGLVGSLFQPTAVERRAQANAEAERRRVEQQQADMAHRQEIERRRGPAQNGDDLVAVLEFVAAVNLALEAGAVERGVVPASTVDEAEQLLLAWRDKIAAGGLEGGEASRAELAIAAVHGQLLSLTGRPGEAAKLHLAALEAGGGPELFDAMTGLPRDPEVDDAVVSACAVARALIPESGVPHFYELCLERAGGELARLDWPQLEADKKAYEAELARLEAEAEAQVQAQAQAAAQAEEWVTAAVFAAGRCRFGDCATEGWETSLPDGTTVTTRCRFSNCLKDGWETSLPDGTATTRCRFDKCLEDGWETSLPSGGSATTRCRFSNCAKDGWETSLPDGSTVVTRCRFDKCFTEGWETSLPNGDTVRCTCRFGKCLEEGTECE